MRKVFLSFLIVFLLAVMVYSKDNSRTAVIPFSAIGVAEIDSLTASNLFETALVQTEAFLIIEQNQIAEILDAQSYTLNGCTDESCAVEIGKLLAAEQIILGSFSKVGSGYIINAKIIDVTLGRNIRAEKVEFSTMDDLSKSMDLLAYKLAGLTYREGGEETIVKAFGELFVSTDPPGADIYVNGVKKGKSPDVVSKVPSGKVLVEVREGRLYGSMEVTVGNEGVKEIAIQMKKMTGNLFIRSNQSNVRVWLDGKDLGALGSGLFKELSVGLHMLELKGFGLYWREEIELSEGETKKIEAYPAKIGKLEYSFPEDVSAVIKGRNSFSSVLSSSGSIEDMIVGTYSITVTGNNYKTLEEKIDIEQGITLKYNPPLEYAEEYKTEIKIKDLKEELGILKKQYEKEGKTVATRNIFNYVFRSLAVGSLGTSGISWYLGSTAYKNYTNALITSEAEKYRDQCETYNVVELSSLSVGAVFTVLSLINWLVEDRRPGLERRVEALALEIAELEAK